jgi:ribosomal protein L33
LSTTACGSRSYTVKLTRKAGSGTARLVVSKP